MGGIEHAPGLLKEIGNLIQLIGVPQSVGLAVFSALAYIGYSIWQDKRSQRQFDIALNAKEEQIQRIAAECQVYREVVLEQAGLSPEQIARLGLKGEEAQRIESKKTKENRAVRRSSRRRKGA